MQKLSQRREGHLTEQVKGIIALGEQYSTQEISTAMQRSLQFGAIGYAKLKAILIKQTEAPQSLPDAPKNNRNIKLDIPCQDVQVERRDPGYYGGVTS